MDRPLNIVVIEPYYGGSHASFVDHLARLSRHRYELITLPARKWKWRMRGAAIWFTRENVGWIKGQGRGDIDLILCCDMLNVADFRALLPGSWRNVPIVCYFHENQLTYPLSQEDRRDYQFGMTNIISCLAADAVWFNSQFHRKSFLQAADQLMRKMPDYVPHRVVDEIREKSSVYFPPVPEIPLDGTTSRSLRAPDGPVTILWSHRWEYDKNPGPFFQALLQLDQDGYSFHIICLGEQFRTAPAVFERVLHKLEKHIVHAGYVPDRAAYLAMLHRCDVVVSTAIQENFGMAVVEAILAGCQPLLPNRLVYPEIIPVEYHTRCLYASDQVLNERLRDLIVGTGLMDLDERTKLRRDITERFTGEQAVKVIDDALVDVYEGAQQ